MKISKVDLLEIDLLKESKEVDRFDYNISAILLLSLLTIIINIVLISISLGVNKVGAIIVGILSYLLSLWFIYLFRLNPTKKAHEKKHDLLRKKYENLGVDVKSLDDVLPKTKKIRWIELLAGILLVSSFLIVSSASYIYLAQNTLFFQQFLDLVKTTDQTLSYTLMNWWAFGIILFGLAIILSFRDIKKVFLFFSFEFVLIIGTAPLLIGLVSDFYLERFRFALIISTFIIYYSVYKAKEFFS